MSNDLDRAQHWETVYGSKSDSEVSWFEEAPVSIALLDAANVAIDASVVDIGGGRSRLADLLLARGSKLVTVVDISSAALSAVRDRLGSRADLQLVVSDVAKWTPATLYDVWHDRAAFHFLTSLEEQAAYARVLRLALRPGGVAVIGTFALDGPEKCSGLPVARHDATSLQAVLGDGMELLDSRRHDHVTPWGSTQHFQFSTFRKR